MIVCFVCHDGPDGARLRQEHLQEHLAFAETVLDSMRVAGPIPAEEGFSGSVVIYEAEDEAACRALFEADPYFKAGVWERVEALPFRAVAGTWIGGKNW